MHGVRPTNRLRRCLGEAEVAHLPLLDQFGHRADGLLDRRVGVDAVLVVEVDVVGAEALERGFAGAQHVLAVAADAEALAGLVAHVGELGRECDLVPATLDRPADEDLVRERAVRVRRVEQGHAELERAVDRPDRLGLLGAPVELGHPHAAQPDRGGLEALIAEPTRLHVLVLPDRREMNRNECCAFIKTQSPRAVGP